MCILVLARQGSFRGQASLRHAGSGTSWRTNTGEQHVHHPFWVMDVHLPARVLFGKMDFCGRRGADGQCTLGRVDHEGQTRGLYVCLYVRRERESGDLWAIRNPEQLVEQGCVRWWAMRVYAIVR